MSAAYDWMELPDLPVRAAVPQVAAALAANRPVVLQAPPGSGKTTTIPLVLRGAPWLDGRRILLLEPRRLAARAAARRMAQLLGENVGGRVGYHIRLERRVSAATEIEIVTEGLLVQRLLHEPDLPDVGLVIFDEFHERALAADQALAMTLDMRRALRPDLRVMVMSATLDAEGVVRLLEGSNASGAGLPAVVRAEGRLWPVATRLLGRSVGESIPRQVADAVLRALAEEHGSVLAFLPGEGEIRRTAELLEQARLSAGVVVAPLYAALSREAQDRAVAPPPGGARKVVLATSIAESSLTIEGIRVVIDSGWVRVPRFSPRNGMSRLETLRITRDRADQRRGRAGRLEPGVCYRLWDEAEEQSMADHAQPEIVDADLAPLVLQCADWGTAAPDALPWPTPPPASAWRQAVALLGDLGALASGADGLPRITGRGRRMAALPIHPRLAHMILHAADHGCVRAAARLAAVVSELAGEAGLRGETDARVLLDRLEGQGVAPGFAQRVATLAQRWARSFAADTREIEAGRLLSWAFPERIARRKGHDGRYQLVSGAGASLAEHDSLGQHEWLAIAELADNAADARIRLAAPYRREWLEEDFAQRMESVEIVAWDRQSESVTAARRSRLGALVLRDSGLAAPDRGAVRAALLEGVRQKGIERLSWRRETEELRARVNFLRRVLPEQGWPDYSDEGLVASLDEWLGPFADGLSRWNQLEKVDLHAALLSYLGALRRQLDTLAPTHFTLPGGVRARISYDAGASPVLAARIQDVFGLAATPKVAGGRVAVVMHLLSPARRPVQVTSDLAGFWSSSYALVRKELRGRYPKHNWPENPFGGACEKKASE